MTQDELKRAAAEAAVSEVTDGMVLGLGTGSTAKFAVSALGARVAAGLRVTAIATSEATAAQARDLGISLTTLEDRPRIDLTIDGADQVHEGTLELIKGLGGALLREKIVASASACMTVIVDESKVVAELGGVVPVPVEVVAFGLRSTLAHLEDAGARPRLRLTGDGQPFLTDGRNLIVDCETGPILDVAALHSRLKGIIGVVETGLFVGLASRVIVGTSSGLNVLER